jgi:hypothetical protein
MASTRRLAAILAADVAGYSRLMGVDEEGTHERLKAHLREVVDPKIAEHRGRIVKNTGDGMLAEFASVVDAVRCAVEVQRRMIDREPDVPEERRRNSAHWRSRGRHRHQHREVDAGGTRRLGGRGAGSYPHPHRRRPQPRAAARSAYGPPVEAHSAAADGSTAAAGGGRDARRTRPQLRCRQKHDFAARRMSSIICPDTFRIAVMVRA